MNRKVVVLALLVVTGVLIGGYRYLQYQHDKEVAEAARVKSLAEAQAREDARKAAKQEQDRLVAEAQRLIDEWSGQGDYLIKAQANLESVLNKDPRHVGARIQMARFHLADGHLMHTTYKPGSLDAATKELRIARSVDPKAQVGVLSAYIALIQGQSREAIKLLEQAEATESNNPWLHMHWSAALMDLKQFELAEAKLRQGLSQYSATDKPSEKIVAGFHDNLSSLFTLQGKLEEADKEFQTALATHSSAWGHGNYANFLLFFRGMPDAAIVQAEKALSIMDYGIGRQTLAAAYYAKWAELKGKDLSSAIEYSERAKKLGPNLSYIMTQAASFVQAGPAIQKMVKEFMAHGVSIDIKDNNGDTGLTLAAFTGRVQSVVILLKYGANKEAEDGNGWTALTNAAYKGHTEVVKILAAAGAKINISSRNYPLGLAVVKGDENMVRTLISLKANVNAQPLGTYTPLMNAALVGNTAMVRLLLQLGANPTILNKETQKTAAELAEMNGHTELAAYIRAAEKKPVRQQL